MVRTALLLTIVTALVSCGKHGPTENGDFKSEKVSRTASFVVHSNIEQVFPLFGAFEERKWEPKWEPILIYPEEEIIEEGTTFKINGHGHGHAGESEFLWIVTKYDPSTYLIQYLVTTNNRFWTINVQCASIEADTKTNTTVTYSYIGLNAKGNELNKTSVEEMYQHDLQDWADAINNYLEQQ